MNKLFGVVLLAVLILLGLWWWGNTNESVVPPENDRTDFGTWREYRNDELGFSYRYPEGVKGYVLVDNESGEEDVILSLALFDRGEYEDLIESQIAREGPPAITLMVFESEGHQNAADWASQTLRSNLGLGDGVMTEIFVAGVNGVDYNWSGLYQGRSVVLLKNNLIFMFSVQYLNPEDKITSDFNHILETISFVETKANLISWAEALDLIEDCEVATLTQAHSLDIYLTKKSGERLVARAPEIDIVFDYVTKAADQCGMIPIATE